MIHEKNAKPFAMMQMNIRPERKSSQNIKEVRMHQRVFLKQIG